MSTGATLADLIADVQLELGHSTNLAIGQQFRGHLTHRIQREYERLYRDFSWPHLRQWVDLPTIAGTKIYTLPLMGGDQLTIEDVREVYTNWGNIFEPLKRGIEIEDYNAFNSDIGSKSDPAIKWEPRSEKTFELWPVPASAAQKLRLKALTPFKQIKAEADICLLDDKLVSMYAAGEYLLRQSSKDAPAVMSRAQLHYTALKQRYQTGVNRVQLYQDGSGANRNDPRNKVFVGIERLP